MNTSEEINSEQDDIQLYSRAYRRDSEITTRRKATKQTKVPTAHKIFIFFLSAMVSCLSVALPLLTDLANSVQSQNLYTGLMLSQGQLPYSDIFATGGFLYYVLIALSYYFGTAMYLIPIQIITFYISGIYFYKLVRYFSDNQKVTITFSFLFFMLNVALGFGGLYPIQFAMPFVLVSLWFLTKYFAGIIKDEAFILYGFAGAASMLLEPRTLVFWAFSLIAIFVYNLKQKHIARGFYQLLSVIFGMVLVLYTVGYFVLNLQILSPYISQAIIYQFTYFAVSTSNFGLTLLFQLAVVFASGLLLGALFFFRTVKLSEDKAVKWLIFVVFLGNLLILVLSQDYNLYHLLPVLPFGLILTALFVNSHYQPSSNTTSHRRKHSQHGKGAFRLFLGYHLYLPIIVLFIGIGQPLIQFVLSSSVNQERTTLANYLKEQTAGDGKIYVWDDSAKIYLDSSLGSSSQFPLPVVNTVKKANMKTLEDELLQNSASYVVVNSSQDLPAVVEHDLATNFQLIEIDGVTRFVVNQKN